MFGEKHKKEMPLLGMSGMGGGNASRLMGSVSLGIDASGGTKSSPFPISGENYVTHTFNSSGSFQVNSLGNIDNTITYLIVGGGGGGGWGGSNQHRGGGGGGGGGMIEGSSIPVTGPTTYPITVGNGGSGSSQPGNYGSNGQNSILTHPSGPFIAYGGGGGASYPSTPSSGRAQPGGSGGGAEADEGSIKGFGYNPSTPGPVLSAVPLPSPYPITQGYPGGTTSGTDASGGGGGAGGAGGQAGQDPGTGEYYAGVGGNGRASTISGSPVSYAGGGGAGTRGDGNYPTTSWGAGGPGGGGDGGYDDGTTKSATNGTANKGGGGGGAGSGGGDNTGANGGSGVVVIRYRVP